MGSPSQSAPAWRFDTLVFGLIASILTALPCAAQIADVPEILYLKFNEGSGTSTADAAIPGVGSMPSLNTVAGWGTAPILGSGCYNAILQSVFGPSPWSTSLLTNHSFTVTGSWTIETWINLQPADPSAYRPICSCQSGNHTFAIARSPFSNDFELSGTGIPAVPLSGALVTGVWNHVAWVYDAGASIITPYLNGVAQAAVAQPPSISILAASQGMYLGRHWFLVPTSLGGSMDDFRFWARARTAAQIQSDMGSELPDNVVRSVALQWPQSPIAFNAAARTFSISGVIESVTRSIGPVVSDPMSDPIVGASVSLSGSYSGNDVTGLGDIVLTNVTAVISVVPGADELSFSSQFSSASGPGAFMGFMGQLKCEPATKRAMGPVGLTASTRIGGGSHQLDGLAGELGNGSLPTLVFALAPSGPLLATIEVDFVTPAPAPQHAFATDGAGRADIGIVGVPPGAPLYNIFAINPSTPVGSGPFVGLEFGPFLVAQLVLPFPAQPFRVAATQSGTYYFSAPAGSVPAGLVADLLSAAIDPATGIATVIGPIKRVQF